MATTKRPQPSNIMLPNVNDPLGTNLKRRGMDAYYEEARKSDPNYMSGPLPDPAWEGLFQAMDEAGVTRVGQDAARPHGLADDMNWWNSGDAGQLATGGIASQPLMKSNNIARPAALEGLYHARRK